MIGRRFDPAVLATVAGTAGDIKTRIAAMQALDLVHRDEKSNDYAFKHVLLRDALYDSLLSAARAALHLKVANEIERRSGNRLVEVTEELAYHYGLTEHSDKAFMYLVMAANKSLNVYSVVEADQYYRRALALFNDRKECAEPTSAAHAAVLLLETNFLKGEFGQLWRLSDQYMPLVKKFGEPRDIVLASYYRSLGLMGQLKHREAEASMREAFAIAEKLNDARARAYARAGLLFPRIVLGLDSFEIAEAMKRKLLEGIRDVDDNAICNFGYFYVAWDYMYRGLMKEAGDTALQLIASGKERNDPRALGYANWLLAWISIVGERFEEALRYADECIRAAITPMDRLTGETTKTVVSIFQGQSREGLIHLDSAIATMERLGYGYNGTGAARGAALALSGRLAEGIKFFKRQIALQDAVGDRMQAAWNRIVLAEIYIQMLSSSERPPLAIVVKNIGVIVGATVFGASRAESLLQQAASNSQFSDQGVLRARINMDLGFLHKLKKQSARARQFFQKARTPAELQGFTSMVRKIDAELAELG